MITLVECTNCKHRYVYDTQTGPHFCPKCYSTLRKHLQTEPDEEHTENEQDES